MNIRRFSRLNARSGPLNDMQEFCKFMKKTKQKTMNKEKGICAVIFVLFVLLSSLFAEDKAIANRYPFKDSSQWFRKYGDYLAYLTVQRASPRGYMISVTIWICAC